MDKKALKLYIENLINRGPHLQNWHVAVAYPTPPCRSSVLENMERMTTTWQPR